MVNWWIFRKVAGFIRNDLDVGTVLIDGRDGMTRGYGGDGVGGYLEYTVFASKMACMLGGIYVLSSI